MPINGKLNAFINFQKLISHFQIFQYFRHSGSVKKSKEGTDKKLSKKQKSIIAQAGLKTLKKAK